MGLEELLPTLQTLPRADKLRIVQYLVSELAKEEGIALFEADKDYPIWTPHNCFEAADTLLNALEVAGAANDD